MIKNAYPLSMAGTRGGQEKMVIGNYPVHFCNLGGAVKTNADLKREYKETPIPMGVFLVRNTQTNEFIIDASRNLGGSINMYKSVLKWGKVNDPLMKNPKVLEDYRTQGEETFEFKILDTLKPKREPSWDPGEDLKALEKIWFEELKSKGWTAY